MNKKKILLLILVLVYLGLAIAYALTIPAWQPYDETGHFYYINYLTENNNLPVMPEEPGMLYEAHQPPVYYFIASLMQRFTIGSDYVSQVLYLRYLSIFIGLFTVIIAYKCAMIIFKNDSILSFIATSIIIFNSTFLAVNSTVCNDGLMILLCSLAIYLFIRELKCKTVSYRNVLLIGVLLGISLLVKLTSIIVLASIILGLFYCNIIKENKYKKFIINVTCLALPVLLMSSWWYIRNVNLYGAIVGYQSMVKDPGNSLLSLNGFSIFWKVVFCTFWYPYQYLRNDPMAKPQPFIYLIWSILSVMGIYAVIKELINSIKNKVSLSCIISFIIFCIILILLAQTYTMWREGRHMLNVFIPIAIVIAMGIKNLRVNKILSAYVIFVVLLLINIYIISNNLALIEYKTFLNPF
ncbi:MAG: glycosyltransferase family 39 protein [Candidatus Omnitrophica bacterium]|nr:glycosyltransferase family 39 protein [Candidatus Omnitrophota bacterium]